jgi:hypothetical protein
MKKFVMLFMCLNFLMTNTAFAMLDFDGESKQARRQARQPQTLDLDHPLFQEEESICSFSLLILTKMISSPYMYLMVAGLTSSMNRTS